MKILETNINLRSARNILWNPAYNAWVARGGFDYRSYIKDTFLSCLYRITDSSGKIDIDADFRLPCSSFVDFPASMGNINGLLKDGLFNLFTELTTQETRIITPLCNALEGSIALRHGLNFEILLIRENTSMFTYIDVFPPENSWSMSSEELDFLRLLVSPLKRIIEEQAPKNSVIQAGILNVNTMKIYPLINDDERLFSILRTIDVLSKEKIHKDTTREKIMKELEHG